MGAIERRYVVPSAGGGYLGEGYGLWEGTYEFGGFGPVAVPLAGRMPALPGVFGGKSSQLRVC